VRPAGDHVERALSSWADRVRIEFDRQPSKHPCVASVTDLSGSRATRQAVDDEAEDADLVLFYCHGGPKAVGVPPLLDESNADLLNGAVVVASACESASSLGGTVVNEGAKAYIGYVDQLVVLPGTRPDPLATAHKEGIAGLVDGFTVSEAVELIQAHYLDIRTKYQGELSGTPNSTFIWLAAHANRMALTAVGDLDATVAGGP